MKKRRAKLDQRGKLVFWFLLFTLAAVIVYLATSAKSTEPEILPEPLDSIIPRNVVRLLDVTRDTPEGTLRPGDDITKALLWACDNAHARGAMWGIPAGTWLVSDTIETPYVSGFVLLGAGTGLNRDHPLAGVRTVLKWTGEEGGTMFHYIGSHGRVGGFTIDGQNKLGIGVLVDRPSGANGLGTGKTIFEPMTFWHCTHAVQNGASGGTHNCDNLTFRWLAGERCRSVYHGVNAQGMDIVIDRLLNLSNDYGVEMDGGGHLWVRTSLTTSPSTLLKINDTSKVFGPNNAFFRLSHPKVDNQAGNGFTLVDSEESSEIRILVDGGIQAPQDFSGTFAKLTGSNFLHVTDFSSTFARIDGRKTNWGTPTVLLESCRIWGWSRDEHGKSIPRPMAELFTGDVNARVRNCTRSDGTWIDWDNGPKPEPAPEPVDWSKEIERLDRRIDGIKLEVPEK